MSFGQHLFSGFELKVATMADKPSAGDGEKKLKPCCACPETKQARDKWCVV